MKLTQLRYFQTICKHNNLTRAASELHVSQPSLSNAIHELEEEFGVSLFYRLSKGLVLTEEGEYFLKEASRLLDQADQLTTQMNALGKTNQTIRLGVPPMLSALVFPQLLQSFHNSFPQIHLYMMENGTVTNTSLVMDGTLDAAIISTTTVLPATLDSWELQQLNIGFCISADHPFATRQEIHIDDVGDTPLALLGEDSFLTSFMRKQFQTAHLTPNVILNTNQLATIYQLIEQGTAASFLFENRQNPHPGIVHVPVPNLPPIHVHLIWNPGRQLSAGTRKLIQFVKSEYS